MDTYDTNPPYKLPVIDRGLMPLEETIDIHPHTSYTDGRLTLGEALEEARANGVYEKGAIEHGNPLDEDIDHITTFLNISDFDNQPYTSPSVYPLKYENIRVIMDDFESGIPLREADPEKLREDISTLKQMDQHDTLDLNDLVDYSTNYSMVVPHGVELDYNPVIEQAGNNAERENAVERYENALIDFLKEAERMDAGYNYVLLSSHYVNTPFRPRYVKRDELFADMTHEEKMEVLEMYREKEIEKIESLSSKLSEMAVPRTSGELMDEDGMNELEEFIYGQTTSIKKVVEEELEDQELLEATEPSLDIENTVVAVGAHPTIIERNTELMDAFRRKEGLTTMEKFQEELNEFVYDSSNFVDEIPGEIDTVSMTPDTFGKADLNEFLDKYHKGRLYPRTTMALYYQPVVEAAEEEENFIFEVNGKGVERQFPSIFWYMLEEKTFGTDAHRPGEQPSRSKEFREQDLPGELVFLSEKWLSQLEDNQEREEPEDTEDELESVTRELENTHPTMSRSPEMKSAYHQG